MKLTIEVEDLDIYKAILSELIDVFRDLALKGNRRDAHTILKTLELLISGEVLEKEATA